MPVRDRRLGTCQDRSLRWIVLATLAILAIAETSCRRGPPDTHRLASSADLGPLETARRLIELRRGHRYHDLEALVAPADADALVKSLIAIDAFLTANQRLCTYVREHIGVGLAQTIDQAYVVDDLSLYAGDDLALFSRDVELLDATRARDDATVSFTVSGRLPAHFARLRLAGNTWRFAPAKPIEPRFAEAMHDMARGLELVVSEIESGRVSTAELHREPERLVELVKSRLRRGVGLLSKAQRPAADAQSRRD